MSSAVDDGTQLHADSLGALGRVQIVEVRELWQRQVIPASTARHAENGQHDTRIPHQLRRLFGFDPAGMVRRTILLRKVIVVGQKYERAGGVKRAENPGDVHQVVGIAGHVDRVLVVQCLAGRGHGGVSLTDQNQVTIRRLVTQPQGRAFHGHALVEALVTVIVLLFRRNLLAAHNLATTVVPQQQDDPARKVARPDESHTLWARDPLAGQIGRGA